MNKKAKSADEPKPQSFEYHLQQLEAIVQQLETGQMELGESLKVFEAGVSHLRHCQKRLQEAEERIALVVQVEPDGTARLKDFSGDASGEPPAGRAGKRSGHKDSDRLF